MHNFPNTLLALKAGKESALRELYEAFFHPLCVFGNRFLHENQAIADIVQEVFIRVWEKRKDFDSMYALRSFMYVSVRNACLNYNRDQLRVRRIQLSDHLSDELEAEECAWVIEEEVHRKIRNEINQLPEAVKKVIELTLAEMSVAEIAGILKLSENTVRNQRARGKELLRKRLNDKIFLLFL